MRSGAAATQLRSTAIAKTVLELTLVIVAGYYSATAFWHLLGHATGDSITVDARTLATRPQRQTALSVNRDMLTSFDPFFRQVQAASEDEATRPSGQEAPETSLDLKLYGLRLSVNDRSKASAVIRTPDGRQSVFTTDSEILDGVRLAEVYTNRVEIRRSGGLESLYLPGKEPGAETAGGARRGAGQQAAGDIDTRSTLSSLSSIGRSLRARSTARYEADALPAESQTPQGTAVNRLDLESLVTAADWRPQRDGRTIKGWRLGAGSAGASLERLGLAAGDVVLAINDTPLTSLERLEEAAEEIGSQSRVSLLIQRGDDRQTLLYTVSGS